MRIPVQGTLLAALLACLGVCLVGAALRVHATIHPPRRTDAPPDLDTMNLRLEQVDFPAVDGVRLRGWHVPGSPDLAPIVLCHDLGRSRASLFGLAFDLSRSGFPLLLFDFRGHGESDGDFSTLGIEEKRDVLGAVDFLGARREYHGKALGVYGVGMGAHAAALAAGDRRSIRVLVLDRLYPDASFRLSRRVYAGWGTGQRRLGFLPETIFMLFTGNRSSESRAADAVPRLKGRDVLLLAAAGDAALTREIEQIYASIPEQRFFEGNLELLPVNHSRDLFGDDRNRHHGGIRDFFLTRLGPPDPGQRAAGDAKTRKNRNDATMQALEPEGI